MSLLAVGEPVAFLSRSEVRILTKNHEERWLEITATAIDFGAEPATLISAFDITERKTVEAQTQLLAVTDRLTGLGNYRRLLDVLQVEIERSARTGRPFALVLLDLDGLKKVNDCYGHLVGSKALCRLADVLRGFGRSIDTAARILRFAKADSIVGVAVVASWASAPGMQAQERISKNAIVRKPSEQTQNRFIGIHPPRFCVRSGGLAAQ